MAKDIWHLKDLDWMSELSDEAREKMRSISVPLRCDAGEIVFMPAPHPESVYLLEAGLIRIYRLSEDGNETTLGYVQPGEVFGELTVLGDYPRESFAQAVEASRVWKIPARGFRPFVKAQPGLALGITKQIGERLKRVESRVENLVFRDVGTRLMLILLELADHFGIARDDGGIEIGLQVTQAELATLIGSTRQTVNVQLRSLEQQGLVTQSGRHLVIVKPDEFRSAARPHDPL